MFLSVLSVELYTGSFLTSSSIFNCIEFGKDTTKTNLENFINITEDKFYQFLI